MTKFLEQDQHDIISACLSIIRNSGWDFEKAKQKLKRIIDNTDTIKNKDDVYIYFSNAFDVISQLAVRKNNC